MATLTSVRTISAPIDLVFQTVADIENFSKAIPHITNVEFLSDVKSGVGARFRETRLMNGREATTTLEVTEHVDNEHVRLVSDTHGTVWDTVFRVKPAGDQVELSMKMDANSYKLLSRIMNLFIKGMIQKALEQDMDAVKTYCESQS